jgi:hypothetical protein
MRNLTVASRELFRRPPDERFETLPDLLRACQAQQAHSQQVMLPGTEFWVAADNGHLGLQMNGAGRFVLNDWSFTQLCGLAGVAKDTVNRLCSKTAAQVFAETLADRVDAETSLQALVLDGRLVRSLNGPRYQRLWNSELVAMLMEFATDFTPPQKGFNGATGLYAGEQDMFAFLIDPTGWVEIGEQAFAPGFFVWNSEVGKRTVGISTFWFQQVCCNHVIWDTIDVTAFVRRHTGRVAASLAEIRQIIEMLVRQRNERKDQFATVIARAMKTAYGLVAEDVEMLLGQAGFSRSLAVRARELAQKKGAFTLWAVVDALTQLAREQRFAGARTEAEQKASALLSIAAT